MGVYQALGARELSVPGDVSVISFDDSDLAVWLQPALSSIALPHRELATVAVDLLLGDERPDAREHRVPKPLRLRDSVAAPRRSRRDRAARLRYAARPEPVCTRRPRRFRRRSQGVRVKV